MTGLSWVTESGFLEYPIALTNTLNVPRVANGVMSWMIARYPEIGITDDTLTPVVAECDDGRLNDIQGRHVSETDVSPGARQCLLWGCTGRDGRRRNRDGVLRLQGRHRHFVAAITRD